MKRPGVAPHPTVSEGLRPSSTSSPSGYPQFTTWAPGSGHQGRSGTDHDVRGPTMPSHALRAVPALSFSGLALRPLPRRLRRRGRLGARPLLLDPALDV